MFSENKKFLLQAKPEEEFNEISSFESESFSQRLIFERNGIIEFDWHTKWLKEYCEKYNLEILPKKTHPEIIYSDPRNGMIYFVEGSSVGSDFGFPRVEIKKRYRWKKMNFTTSLPKKKPLVTYIVASAVKCEKFFPGSKGEGPAFRMHAVILNGDYEINENENNKNYILCHIRKIDSNYKISKTVKKGHKNSSNSIEKLTTKKKTKIEAKIDVNEFIEFEENLDNTKRKLTFSKIPLNHPLQYNIYSSIFDNKIFKLINNNNNNNTTISELNENTRKLKSEKLNYLLQENEKYDYNKIFNLLCFD